MHTHARRNRPAGSVQWFAAEYGLTLQTARRWMNRLKERCMDCPRWSGERWRCERCEAIRQAQARRRQGGEPPHTEGR